MSLQDIIYKYRFRESMEEGVIWVSDLVKCSLKVHYEEKYPEFSLLDIYHLPFILGDLVHKGLECIVVEYCNELDVKGFVKLVLKLPPGPLHERPYRALHVVSYLPHEYVGGVFIRGLTNFFAECML